MRTSVEIPDALLARARQAARLRKTTLRQLVIAGLRHVTEQAVPAPGFRLRDASFGAGGLVAGLTETDWEEIRRRAYEERGG